MSGSPAVGELPPIRQNSPQSALLNGTGTGRITLPTISEQLGNIHHLPAAAAEDLAFSKFSLWRPPPQSPAVPGDISPRKSPNKAFRLKLPSPRQRHFDLTAKSHRKPSQTNEPQLPSTDDNCGSNPATPSTDQSGSTPGTLATDRMSIDGITNPQIKGFQCTYPGCTAKPFQNQVRWFSH
jgi:hypothetical protein